MKLNIIADAIIVVIGLTAGYTFSYAINKQTSQETAIFHGVAHHDERTNKFTWNDVSE